MTKRKVTKITAIILVLMCVVMVSTALAYQYLFWTNTGIGKVSATVARATASTEATQNVNTVSVTVQLQRLYNGSWQNYGSSYTATRSNYFYVDISRDITIERGYAYRTMSIHTVIHNGKTETAFPIYSGGMAFA